jgi:DNA-binding PadR family transcriptional regulator
MLYLALKQMSQQGLVEAADVPRGFSAGGGRPRFYHITPLGRRASAAEATRLQRLVNVARAKRVLRESTR